ncbi:MAG: tol-pal system protein YbgF [Gemmatimonadetes bacterium]|nr:tol-pal system protein YbgF [Gemmatimonadota bacterium]
MRPYLAAALAFCTSATLSAQTVQYHSRAGVDFTAAPDTGAVARATNDLAADPKNVDKIITLGLAQSAVKQYKEAIATFSRGIALAPRNPILYRWRGHRYISIGAFDKALADLTRGNTLDSMNYDILYHLGVAHFERGEFSKAADTFIRARRRAPNANEFASVADWLWMSASRAKRPTDAQGALAAMTDTVKMTTPTAYWQRLSLYRGITTPAEVLTKTDTAAVQVATLSFGVGNWYLVRGDTANAKLWFHRAVDSGGWPGFAFFASETELKRLH